MVIYDGIYRWGGKRKMSARPISWWPSAYRLKIIDLSKSKSDVYILKPIIIVVSDTGEGASATNCAQYLVKSVCQDFNLDFNKVIWIEYYPKHPVRMEVASLKPMTQVGTEKFYDVKWRPIRQNELEMIKPYISEARNIVINHKK